MAQVDVNITELDIGALDVVEGHVPRYPSRQDEPRLLLQGKDGTKVLADATREQIDLFEMVWLATNYGDEGEAEAATLADLRAAHAAMKSRWRTDAIDLGGVAAE